MTSSTTSLSEWNATHRNADSFRRDLAVLHSAAVGVIMTRTQEPMRAIEAIRTFSFAKTLPLYVWSVLSGWTKHNTGGSSDAPDMIKDPNMALQRINGLDGGTPHENGFYVMYFPHHWLKSGQAIPPMLQVIKDYCRALSKETERRLILVMPQGFVLPPEIEGDVAILDFDLPSYAELSDTLTEQIDDCAAAPPHHHKISLSKAERDQVISAGAGMTASDFEAALCRAFIVNGKFLPHISGDMLASSVMEVKIDVVKRSDVLEVMDTIDMSQVGGLDGLKDWVNDRIGCFSEDAEKFGIEAPKGIALIGPPGTGKSLLARAVANSLKKPLIKFDVSRVFQGLVGASEERVRAALKMLEAMAPCVVMLDEVDKAFQVGSTGDSGVSTRILGAILTFMQESKAAVFWVATANRTTNLPAEFLRRGRLDEVFSVSVPDAKERMDVIKIHINKRKHDASKVSYLDAAVAASDGFVPAEIEAAVKDALITAYVTGVPLDGNLIAKQFSEMKPLSESFADQFAEMQTWAENNARPASNSTRSKLIARARVRPNTNSGPRALVLDDGDSA